MPWNEARKRSVTPDAVRNASALRDAAAGPERRLWRALRQRVPIEGSHFRRQFPLGPYVVDFCCLSHRLVIEVDGNQHGEDNAIRYDERRTAYLEQSGFRVVRFSNRDVMTDIDVVIETIVAALGISIPTPGPSPQGGE